ncbi:MAG: DUF2931 family protein [Paludibacteraceae bacterium]|nr:DUF2931 family protein [Paludibacteraceae bacterium]
MVIIVALVVVGLSVVMLACSSGKKNKADEPQIVAERDAEEQALKKRQEELALKKKQEEEDHRNGKFSYGVAVSSPAMYRVSYLNIKFIGETGSIGPFGCRTIYGSGIGTGHDGVARDDEYRYGLPKMLNAAWVSFTERKVYKLTVELPYEEILRRFQESAALEPRGGMEYVYHTLDLCILPEGKVVLVLKSSWGKILLDWSAQGEETHEFDDDILNRVNAVADSMDEYYDWISEVSNDTHWVEYYKTHGLVTPVYDRYLERFNYKIIFDYEDKVSKIVEYIQRHTNGELYWIDPSEFVKLIEHPSRVKEIRLEWDTKDSHYTGFLYFNEEEVLRVFDEAYGEDRMQQGELRIKVGADCKSYDLSLNVGGKSFKLEKTEIRVFQDPIDDPDGDGTLIYKNYEGNHRNLFIDDKGYFQE